MQKYVAFVRNVMQGRRGLTRDLLVDAFEKNGAINPVTHFTTGNVSFQLNAAEVKSFRKSVEHDIGRILQKQEPVFIVSLNVLSRIDFDIIYKNYYTDDIYERCITFIDKSFDIQKKLPVQLAKNTLEIIKIEKRFVFSATRLYNGAPGSSPNAWAEKNTGLPASTRSINTVIRILKYQSGESGK